MLVIRFQRVGRKSDPAFRIMVCEKRSKPKTSGIEILGSHHPKTKQTILKEDRILYWIGKGAQVSDTVHNLLISRGIVKGKKIDVAGMRPGPTERLDATPTSIPQAASVS